ncbi:tRNA nucleotidyltransferase (CCA-adding enzyme) [Pseudohyphozyma bogoriensis]|nr:tRNA nucleotidyltransferase (CCA-adding enzyme) [Pseudohyphozyma bogoriensis]
MSTSPTITLTPSEAQLADLLVSCATWIEQHPEEVDALRLVDDNGVPVGKLRGDDKVELRIAGGWVRDKLLGLQSSDIDVSISPDPITGLKFAALFERFLDAQGKRDIMGKLTKIEAKPEQSKHLETATAMVLGLSVDWVQQRGTEVYNHDSRIPTVSFGTPLEDAERRDLTINALFYNLMTREVEDQTAKGLADLGLVPGTKPRIRTPLAPFQTFRDDPLRVIRAVRFAARFGREFELDEELREAVERKEIREALMDGKKISRERVGAELDKMLLGKDPLLAMELILSLHLHDLIFLYDKAEVYPVDQPPNTPHDSPNLSLSLTASQILASIFSDSPTISQLHHLLRLTVVPEPEPTKSEDSSSITHVSPTIVKRLYLSAALLPLYGLSAPDKKKVCWVGEKVVHTGIKGTTGDKLWVTKAREASMLLSKGVETFGDPSKPVTLADRAEIGLLLRNVAVHDITTQATTLISWNVSLLWSLVVDLVKTDPSDYPRVVSWYITFIDRIVELQLDQTAFYPPLLDGKEINVILPETKNSPAMAHISQLVVRYQLGHPDATKDDCVEWLEGEEANAQVATLLASFPMKGGGGKKKKEKE